jgi:hypothetical protein
MSGLNKVFIFFVPIVGLCLVMSLFIKVRILRFAGTDRAGYFTGDAASCIDCLAGDGER